MSRVMRHSLCEWRPVPPPGVVRIGVDDLYVGVEANACFLYSAKLGKRVRLRSTHMMNPAHMPPVARFLDALTRQGTRAPGPRFSQGLQSAPFIPRIRCGRLVLSRARWLIDAQELADDARTRAVLEQYRVNWALPRFCYLVDADNRLVIETTSEAGRGLLRDQGVKAGRKFVVLQEMLPGFEHAWLRSADGPRFAEFVADFVRTPRAVTSNGARLPVMDLAQNRERGPGSDWVYLKLYGGQKRADELLRSEVPALVERLKNGGRLVNWFFVRFADPLPHVRLRFHFSDVETAQHELTAMFSWAAQLLAEAKIDRYAADTYVPELERYGGAQAMLAVERLFSIDSDAALAALARTPRDVDERCVAAVLAFDPFARVAGDDATADNGKQPKLDANDRANIKRLERLLGNLSMAPLDAELEACAKHIAALSSAGRLTVSPADIWSSVFHMHCNRFGVGVVDERRVRMWMRGAYRALGYRNAAHAAAGRAPVGVRQSGV